MDIVCFAFLMGIICDAPAISVNKGIIGVIKDNVMIRAAIDEPCTIPTFLYDYLKMLCAKRYRLLAHSVPS